MQFYDGTNLSGICQEIDRLCDSDDTAYPRLAKTSRVNQAMEELVGEIILQDGKWQYDDTNYTTLPRGLGTLVEGQQTYSFASEYLDIEAVEIKDLQGNFRRIKPIDHKDLDGMSPDEYFGTNSGTPLTGMPEWYDKVGDTIFLYPTPTATYVTLASGIRVWFKRAPQAFTATSATTADTTEPGLPSSYHVLLAYMAAIPYCMSYKPERVALYEKKKDELKKKVLAFYGKREADSKKFFSTQPVAFR